MRILILLLALMSCGTVQRPGDILGPGTMCESKSEVFRACRNGSGRRFDCIDQGGRWTCKAVR